MRLINKERLMKCEPVEVRRFKNQLEQEVVIYEDPFRGKEAPFIGVIGSFAFETHYTSISDFDETNNHPVLFNNEVSTLRGLKGKICKSTPTEDFRKWALVKELGIQIDKIKVLGREGAWLETDDAEYYVLTDEEAEKEWNEKMDHYIDKTLLYGVAKEVKDYFNKEVWKRDQRSLGRGGVISSTDGVEDRQVIADICFYIYKVL